MGKHPKAADVQERACAALAFLSAKSGTVVENIARMHQCTHPTAHHRTTCMAARARTQMRAHVHVHMPVRRHARMQCTHAHTHAG